MDRMEKVFIDDIIANPDGDGRHVDGFPYGGRNG